MKTYEFTIVLKAQELTLEQCGALYEAGCDDGTIVTRNRTTQIAFDRQTDSLAEAIRSASENVRQAGFEIERVQMDAFV
jgi:hypothetical protein